MNLASLQVQQALQAEAAARARASQPLWMGNPLQPGPIGPQAGVPVGGVPYQLPPIPNIPTTVPTDPRVAYGGPGIGLPSLPSIPAMEFSPAAGAAADMFNRSVIQPAAMDNLTRGVPLPVAIGGNELKAIGEWIGGGGKPKAKAGSTAAADWQFAGADAATPAAVRGVNPILADLAARLAAQGATATSGLRSEDKNKAVGGVPNSFHLTGDAIDIVPPKGVTTKQLHDSLAGTGIKFTELLDEGDHVHIAIKGRDPWTVPTLPRLDPGLANAIPLPGKARTVDLPTRPDMPQTPDRPAAEELPVEQWMADLRKLAPKAFDEKAANAGRLGTVIAGMAAGAASTDARQGLSAMLAAMGAGAGRAQAGWAAQTKADKKEADEASRLFELGLVRQGIDFSTENKAIRERNADRRWEDQRSKLLTDYTNKANKWEDETKELLTNNNILRDWDREMLEARTARARTGLSIVEFNTQQSAAEITGQSNLDLKRFLYEEEKGSKAISPETEKFVNAASQRLGIDPKLALAKKDATSINALQGFAYMGAGNKTAAIKALARELVLSGQYKALVTDKTLQKHIELAATRDPELAAVILGNELNADEAKTPGTVLGLAKAGAAFGLPLASAFNIFAQPTPAQVANGR